MALLQAIDLSYIPSAIFRTEVGESRAEHSGACTDTRHPASPAQQSALLQANAPMIAPRDKGKCQFDL